MENNDIVANDFLREDTKQITNKSGFSALR